MEPSLDPTLGHKSTDMCVSGAGLEGVQAFGFWEEVVRRKENKLQLHENVIKNR